MVKLATKLPKEHSRNGLEARTNDLISTYRDGGTIAVVALVRATEVTDTKDYERIPRIEIVHVETADASNDEQIRDLLRDMHDERVRHVQEPIDFGDDLDVDNDTQAAIEAAPSTTTDADIVDAELITETEK